MQLRKTRNLEFLRPNVQVPRGIRVFDRTRLVYTSNVSHICQLCLNRIYFIFSESLSKTLVKCHSEHMCIYFLEINCSGFPVPYQRDCYFMFFLQGVTFPCIFLWNIDNTTVFTSKQKRVEIELLLHKVTCMKKYTYSGRLKEIKAKLSLAMWKYYSAKGTLIFFIIRFSSSALNCNGTNLIQKVMISMKIKSVCNYLRFCLIILREFFSFIKAYFWFFLISYIYVE